MNTSSQPAPDLVEVYTDLRADCVRQGHALGQKEHEADLWVAATAIWFDIPLVDHDGIFENVTGLRTITHLSGAV